MGPVLAQKGPADHGWKCPFIGVKPSHGSRSRNDAIDPTETWVAGICCNAQRGIFLQRCGRVQSSDRGQHMRRREFITFLGGAAASPAIWPLAAHGQQVGKVHRVGFLWDGPDVFPDAIEAFVQGLGDLGYVEGRNLAIEYRWGEGKPDRMR